MGLGLFKEYQVQIIKEDGIDYYPGRCDTTNDLRKVKEVVEANRGKHDLVVISLYEASYWTTKVHKSKVYIPKDDQPTTLLETEH